MSTLDTRPMVVDVHHYAGDTLRLHISVEDDLSDGMVWRAQIKRNRTALPDAEFTITPYTGGAELLLTAAESERLAAIGVLAASGGHPLRGSESIVAMASDADLTYSGQWDVEISNAGSDPITTLAQGAFTIDTDVTDTAP